MFTFGVISALVIVTVGLFSAAAMWNGPGDSLRIWLYNE